MGTKVSAEKIVTEGLKKAQEEGCDLVFIDTAGLRRKNKIKDIK